MTLKSAKTCVLLSALILIAISAASDLLCPPLNLTLFPIGNCAEDVYIA